MCLRSIGPSLSERKIWTIGIVEFVEYFARMTMKPHLNRVCYIRRCRLSAIEACALLNCQRYPCAMCGPSGIVRKTQRQQTILTIAVINAALESMPGCSTGPSNTTKRHSIHFDQTIVAKAIRIETFQLRISYTFDHIAQWPQSQHQGQS